LVLPERDSESGTARQDPDKDRRKNMKNSLIRKVLILAAAVSVTLCSFVPAMAQEASGGTYRSELTNEWISTDIQNQRPIAVMVDNESISLPHFGTAEGDIVYELMNSLANNRITRLMIVLKDWGKISQMGNIRSTRTANIPLAAEWNAVLVHDGGPFYVNEYFIKPYAAQHFGGDFSRVNNGKSMEYTEYVLGGDLERKFSATGFPTNYNEFRNADTTHFNFVQDDQVLILSSVYQNAQSASEVSLPFYHNSSTLRYNAQTGTYDYYEFGQIHQDSEDGQVMTFKNVILQDTAYEKLDENGYMNYYVVDSGKPGYYITNGEAIPITWTKNDDTDITRYFDGNGNEIQINTGKTYIALVPDDTWNEVGIY
jgi:hypothetical protein